MNTIIYDWRLTDSHPLHVMNAEHRPGNADRPTDMHSSVHIGILLEGDMAVLINGEKFMFRAGDFYLTAPWEPHRRLSSERGNKLLMLTADPESVNRAMLSGADKLNLLYRIKVAERQHILDRCRLDQARIREIQRLLSLPDSRERELRLWHTALGIFLEIATLEFSAEPDADYSRLLPSLRKLGSRPIAVPEAAAECGLSESRFAHLFKQVFGISFAKYERLYRLRCALDEMQRRHAGLKETAENWGFYDKSHFAKARRKYFFDTDPSGTD